LPKFLELEDCKKLLSSIESENTERDYAIVQVFLNCGLRLSELVSLNLNSIENNRLRVIGKGDKERVVPLNQVCLSAIQAYLAKRPKTKCNAIFLSEKKQRISETRIQKMMKDYLVDIGHGDLSTHSLRHAFACLMLSSTNDLKRIQELLGHESIATTGIYLHLTDKQLQNAVDSNPLNTIAE
jgi:integrase/recombinase XerD